MHPIATMAQLLGLEVRTFGVEGTNPRLFRSGDMRYMLAYNNDSMNRYTWDVFPVGEFLTKQYVLSPWSAVPDAVWDRLPAKVLQAFAAGDNA